MNQEHEDRRLKRQLTHDPRLKRLIEDITFVSEHVGDELPRVQDLVAQIIGGARQHLEEKVRRMHGDRFDHEPLPAAAARRAGAF